MYTPSNAPAWQVEAGNVGQHYYIWRYGELPGVPRIAFASMRTGNWDIFTIDASGSDLVNLTNSPEVEPTFTVAPDGTRIAFVREYRRTAPRSFGDVFVINSDGSGLVNLTSSSELSLPLVTSGMDIAWSPDSRRIAYSCLQCPDPGSSLYVMDADGSDVRRLHYFEGGKTISDLAWSPDGTAIAFTYSHEHEAADVYVVRLEGSEQVINLSDHPANDSQPAWSPDGSRIAFFSHRDAGQADIFVMQPDGSGVINLTQDGRVAGEINWSPDGSRTALTMDLSDSAGVVYGAIFAIDAGGTTLQQFTNGQVGASTDPYVGDFSPRWSPDGQQLAYVSYRDGNAEIFVMKADGMQQANLTNSPSLDRDPVWMP